MRLKKRGSGLVNKELNILKIIKNLRDMKILMKSKLLDKETKFEIQHSTHNVINIDNTTTDENDDEENIIEKRRMKKIASKQDNMFLNKGGPKSVIEDKLKT